jgi:hypothetical protein
MTRHEKFARRYAQHAAAVLSSIARTAAAGRSRNPARIAAARAQHYRLMADVLSRLGT